MTEFTWEKNKNIFRVIYWFTIVNWFIPIYSQIMWRHTPCIIQFVDKMAVLTSSNGNPIDDNQNSVTARSPRSNVIKIRLSDNDSDL